MATKTKSQHRDRTLESELKFKLGGPADHARLRRRLEELEARPAGTYDEENVRFFQPGKRRPVSLRLRILDGRKGGILTVKGPARFIRGIKVREETEVGVDDSQAARDLVESLGYTVAFTYHKHRSTWRLKDVDVTLDTLAFGFFTELEGPPEVLEETARLIGLNPVRAIRSSYSALARRHALLQGTKTAPSKAD